MRRTVMAATVITFVAMGSAAILALAGGKGAASSASSCDPAACGRDAHAACVAKLSRGSFDLLSTLMASCGSACGAGTKTAAVVNTSGKILGHFDATMAGCQFACATRLKYDAKAVMAQPGARNGKLTQCPVSGVVFTVDATRPHVEVGSDDYVTCCAACAEKLRKDPHRFVRS